MILSRSLARWIRNDAALTLVLINLAGGPAGAHLRHHQTHTAPLDSLISMQGNTGADCTDCAAETCGASACASHCAALPQREGTSVDPVARAISPRSDCNLLASIAAVTHTPPPKVYLA
jgi:hypothetical protein